MHWRQKCLCSINYFMQKPWFQSFLTMLSITFTSRYCRVFFRFRLSLFTLALLFTYILFFFVGDLVFEVTLFKGASGLGMNLAGGGSHDSKIYFNSAVSRFPLSCVTKDSSNQLNIYRLGHKKATFKLPAFQKFLSHHL